MSRSGECDVLVVGGINTDYLGQGDALPQPGETRNGQQFLESPGGKGANQAVAAARLGARVSLIGAVGDDERGPQLLAHLKREHVDVAHVVHVSNASTGAALIHVDRHGEKQILAVLAANGRLDVAHVEAACKAIGGARVVLAQLEVPLECVVSVLRWGRRVGAQTILDPAPAMPLSDSVLTLLDVIRPNASEAETLTRIRVVDRDTARRAAHELLSRGARHAIVQAGSHGNLLVSRDVEQWLPRLKVDEIDATGAGDAFAGTLAACLARGDSMADASTLANAAAALETTALGVQTPRVSEDQLRAVAKRPLQQV